MIDYIEGVLTLNQLIKQLHEQLLHKQYLDAKETCHRITAEFRLVFNQIKIQENDLP
jgi:hypothetical protein